MEAGFDIDGARQPIFKGRPIITERVKAGTKLRLTTGEQITLEEDAMLGRLQPALGVSGVQHPGLEDGSVHPIQTGGKLPDESQVVNPDYYEIPGIEWDHPVTGRKTLTVWDIVHAMNLNHQQGNILKYVIRAGRKPGQSRAKDTRKVFWCAVSELRRLGENPPNEKE